MKHIKIYENFINEGFWNFKFGRPTVQGAAKDSVKSQGYSQMGKDSTESEDYYTVFQGQKFYEGDIEYAGVYDTGQIPRIENGKLIIANPQWRE